MPVLDDALTRCKAALLPDARLPNAQVSTWLPTAPAIEHVPGPLYTGLIDQLMPDPAGSGSFNVTLFSVPEPALLTLIVKPMPLPVVTTDASGVLLTFSAPAVLGGNATMTSFNCFVLPPIPASTDAVALKNVVISNSNWQAYDLFTPVVVIG